MASYRACFSLWKYGYICSSGYGLMNDNVFRARRCCSAVVSPNSVSRAGMRWVLIKSGPCVPVRMVSEYGFSCMCASFVVAIYKYRGR